MVEAVRGQLRRPFLLLALLAFPWALSAHQLDEYVQATLVVLEPGEIRLDLNLTPGVAVAQQVLTLMDRDHDGVISTNEGAAYAELVKRDLGVQLDGREVELKLAALNFPEPEELHTGWGIVQMEFSGKPGVLSAGPHHLTLQNRHLPAISVYLFNAARPGSASIQITGQKRNESQSTGEIAFDFHHPPSPYMSIGAVVSLATLSMVVFAVLWQARKNREAECKTVS